MDTNMFLSGLYGSLIGSSAIALTIFGLFVYEKRQANKKADQLMGDLKAIYSDRLNQGLSHVANKVPAGKYN